MKFLLINPNRSEWVTERVAGCARPMLLPGEQLDTVTSVTGPAVVQTPEQAQEAAHEVQRLALQHGAGYDAIVLGISLDTGLFATRHQQQPQIVIGMTEAACWVASTYGPQFGVLTIGPMMQPLYAQHLQQLGIAARCVAIEAPACAQPLRSNGAGLDADTQAALLHSVQRLQQQGASSVVLAGAVLCGQAAFLSQHSGVPVLEGPACAVGLARTRWHHQQRLGLHDRAV